MYIKTVSEKKCFEKCPKSFATLQSSYVWIASTWQGIHSMSWALHHNPDRIAGHLDHIDSFILSSMPQIMSIYLTMKKRWIHPLTHTHSLTRSLTCSLTHSLAHSLTHSFAYSLTHSLICLLTHSLAQSISLSLIHSLQLLTHSLQTFTHFLSSCSVKCISNL